MDISAKIFELVGNVDPNYKNLTDDEKIKILNGLNEEWDKLPDEKYENNDKSLLALFLSNAYIVLKQFDKAKKWTEILLMDRLDDPSQVGIYNGILNFEQNNYEEAYKYFDMAYKDSKQRIFRDRDKKYFDFYKNYENK